jgi:uncharacterized protein YqgV (UPF0045/DUF77 family)
MAMMEISVVPVGTGEPGVSRYVAACLEAVAAGVLCCPGQRGRS